jgi:hypothetical protein
MSRCLRRFVVCLALLTTCAGAGAANFSFTGTFNQDDDVQLFRFAVAGPSFTTVTLQTLSYDGGLNTAGALIPPGGFDPVISLFDAGGTLLDDNDDGSFGPDAFLRIALGAGNYLAALTESPNRANGPNLADGFLLAGTGNFTGPGFVDVFGNQRDGHWALDVLNVASAVVGIAAVPSPGTLWLLAAPLLALAVLWRPRPINRSNIPPRIRAAR